MLQSGGGRNSAESNERHRAVAGIVRALSRNVRAGKLNKDEFSKLEKARRDRYIQDLLTEAALKERLPERDQGVLADYTDTLRRLESDKDA